MLERKLKGLGIRGCHTSFFPFSIFREWGRGTLPLKGGGRRMENREWRMDKNIFSSTGEEWRMEKTSCAKVLLQSFCFSPGRFIYQATFAFHSC